MSINKFILMILFGILILIGISYFDYKIWLIVHPNGNYLIYLFTE